MNMTEKLIKAYKEQNALLKEQNALLKETVELLNKQKKVT